jgi:porin
LSRSRRFGRALLGLIVASGTGSAAEAQEGAPSGEQPASADAAAAPHAGSFWTRDVLTGDWGGRRAALEDAGIIVGADSFDEFLGNVSGGARRGAIYEGRLEVLLTIDLDKLLSWSNATLHANAYQIHGRGLSSNDLGNNLLVASNIEATRSTRLFDLWVEQLLWDGAVSIRAGQIAADDEFFTSQYASNFINATFGWPAIMNTDLPSGGPAYPLATPGARLKYAATTEVSFQAALFNGDPAGPGSGDPQRRDPSGTSFRIGDSSLVIAEAGYARNQDRNAPGLPASYKLGAWYHSGAFADQRFGAQGQSLAAQGSTGIPAVHSGNYGLYAVLDHMVWRKPDTADQGVAVFVRAAAAPSDRNPVTLYGDLGVTLKGPLPGRDDDVFGIAAGVAAISQRARALDADEVHFSGIARPIRDGEGVLEVTYRYQASPWWTLQPDFQFIRHPGAGAPLPIDPAGKRRVPDTAILGFRSSIIF